ncbi:MAG: PEP-CTERM sorting domain-containing protein [Armatimonadetes bacterium]|nr:PEP-CTERM sorting domain-containing protein [Armatimonadota bacterium]
MKKLSLIGLALAAVCSAQASIVITLSNGNYSIDGSGNYLTTETLTYSTVANLNAGGTLHYICQNFLGGVGTATFSNGTDNLVFDVQIQNASSNGQVSSADGQWVYDSGLSTGVFSGMAGAGTYSQSFHGANQFAASEFVGELTTVPEPASLIALGTGAVALIRRRNRK